MLIYLLLTTPLLYLLLLLLLLLLPLLLRTTILLSSGLIKQRRSTFVALGGWGRWWPAAAEVGGLSRPAGFVLQNSSSCYTIQRTRLCSA